MTGPDSSHKIDFAIDKDDAINLEYNDKIRAVSKKSSLLESLKLMSTISETSLLYVYLESYLPIINFLLGSDKEEATMSSITDMISSVKDGISFAIQNSNVIDIDIDFSKCDLGFLGVDTSSIPNMSLSINLSPDSGSLIDVTIKNFTYNEYEGEVTVSIMPATEEVPSDFGFTDGVGMVYLEDLPILMKMGLEIVDKNAYYMSGTLSAKTSGVVSWFMSVNIDAKVNCYLRVGEYVDEDGLYSVDGYIEIINSLANEGDNAFSTRKITDHVTTTRFMIKDKNAYVHQNDNYKLHTRSSVFKSWSTTSVNTNEYFKLTQEVMLRDGLYYVLSYALGATDLYDEIEKSVSSSSSSSMDFFSMFKYFKLLNEGTFQARINAYNLMDIYADINYDTNDFSVTSIHAYTNFNILIGAVSLDLSITNMKIKGVEDIASEMAMFDKFISDWYLNDTTKDLLFRPDIDSTGSEYVYRQ